MTLLSKLGCIGGAVGCGLVSLGLPFEANVIWVVSNAGMISYTHSKKEYDMRNMFIVYWFIAAVGVVNLWK